MQTTLSLDAVHAALITFCRANDAKLTDLLSRGWDAVIYEGQPMWSIAEVAVEFPGYAPVRVIGVVMDFGHMPIDLVAALTVDGVEPASWSVQEAPLTQASYRQFCERQRAMMAS